MNWSREEAKGDQARLELWSHRKFTAVSSAPASNAEAVLTLSPELWVQSMCAPGSTLTTGTAQSSGPLTQRHLGFHYLPPGAHPAPTT